MTLRVAQFFLKIAHLSFSMGPRGPRAYGLRPRLWLLVIIKVGDRISNDGTFLKREKVLKAKLSPNQLFVLMGIVNALPSEWHTIMHMKGNAFSQPSPLNESSYFLSVKGEMMDFLNIRSKNLYKEFCSYPRLLLKANWKANIQAFWVNGQKYTLCLLRLL